MPLSSARVSTLSACAKMFSANGNADLEMLSSRGNGFNIFPARQIQPPVRSSPTGTSRSSSSTQTYLGSAKTTPRGFEPHWAEPNGFRVHLFNSSDRVSLLHLSHQHPSNWACLPPGRRASWVDRVAQPPRPSQAKPSPSPCVRLALAWHQQRQPQKWHVVQCSVHIA
jgi:hypothetical protein